MSAKKIEFTRLAEVALSSLPARTQHETQHLIADMSRNSDSKMVRARMKPLGTENTFLIRLDWEYLALITVYDNKVIINDIFSKALLQRLVGTQG